MTQDTISMIGIVVVALGTVVIAILAIWGDLFRRIFAGPLLDLELFDTKGDLINRNDGGNAYFYHLKVTNRRTWSPARSTRVFVVAIEKKSADDEYYHLPHVAPLPLVWAHQQFHELSPTIGPEDRCDLGHLDEGADKFELEVLYWPNNFDGRIARGESMRVSISAYAHNGGMKDPLVLEISWDGGWSPDRSEMEKHLVIKKIEIKPRR